MTHEKREAKRISREERRTYSFEATVTPEVLERGRHWITVRLRNLSMERLVDVSDAVYL